MSSQTTKWHIKYNNDTGPRDDYFYEWWDVLDTDEEIGKCFKCDVEEDANWLCDILNQLKK